jgi:Uma2 family endonuclease
LVGFVRRHRLGTVLPAPFEIVLSDFDVVQPDLVFISRERAGILTEKNARGAPDLAIEILSPRTRQTDEVHKLRLYERSGVREYWLIDPLAETARIYRRRGERLALHRDLTAAGRGALTTPLLPGLRIPLAELCEE